jgi:hypothetical protein
MSRSWIKVALVSLGLAAVPALAFAGANTDESTALAKGDKDHEKKFPMKADTFLEKVNGRIAKAEERVTKRLEERNVPEEKRKEVLAKFSATAEQVRAAAKAAGEDGTVTADEAKQVRKVAKELRGKHKGKKGEGKGKKGKKDKGSEAAASN